MVKDNMSDVSAAQTTNDEPLPVASQNFESRKIQIIDDVTLRIKPSLMALAFCLMFALPGVVLIGLWVATSFTAFDGPGSFPMLLIGMLFTAAGLGFYYSSNEQIVVNREAGVAFIRSWHPSVSLDASSVFRHIQPHEISAIQTLSRVVKHRTNRSKRRSRFTEYQVNVCLIDGERHNLLTTLKAEKSDKTGQRMATIFNVPMHAK